MLKEKFSVNADSDRNYYIPALALQLGVVMICVLLHRIFIHIGGLLEAAETVGDEVSDPTAGRLVFAMAAAAAFVLLSYLASKKAEEGKDFVPFLLGAFAGTFLWQCIGEDMWNFSVGGEHFAALESVSVLPLAILFILFMIYCRKNNSLDWGITCVCLEFAVNWLGHYVLIGVYPLFSGLCSETLWCRTVGIILGLALLIYGIISGVKKSQTHRQQILFAMLTYYAMGLLVFGIKG